MRDLIQSKKDNGWVLLPAKEGTCEQCAVDHDPLMPHNQQSLFWQYWFYYENNRWPTWLDAMEHCSEQTKERWKSALLEHGVDLKGEMNHE